MSDATTPTCVKQGCSGPVTRRCYFCENSFCRDHVTVTNGAICEACRQRENQKQEARRQEQERRRQEAQTAAKGSGCLVAIVLLGLPLLSRIW